MDKIEEQSRIKYSFKNALSDTISYFITIILSFVVRTIFIHSLSAEYLGVNGLFTNVLSMLSLAELGISNAIIFKLYKPVAENNTKKICELMNFYRQAYTIIGIVVAIMGLVLLPFLNIFISEEVILKENIEILYLLFLLNSVLSYFFIYKKSLIIAHQKQYISSIVNIAYTIVMSILQIIVLIVYKNYILYLMVQIVCNVAQNAINSILCDKMYPYLLNNKNQLNSEEKKSIFKDVKALILYRISGIVVSSTDNLIISSLIGVVYVGLYSNYYLIINSLYSLIKRGLNSITASVGNLNVSSDLEKQCMVYNTVIFISSVIHGIVSIELYMLLNPFISFWIGTKYLFNMSTVILLVINFYLQGITQTYNIFRNTFGLFVQGQFRPIISSFINLFSSLIFAKLFGINGVFFGTLLSYISIYVWYDPLIVYKYALHKDVKIFYYKSIKYLLVPVILCLFFTCLFNSIVFLDTLITIVLKGILIFIVSICFYIFIFRKSNELKYTLKIIKSITKLMPFGHTEVSDK